MTTNDKQKQIKSWSNIHTHALTVLIAVTFNPWGYNYHLRQQAISLVKSCFSRCDSLNRPSELLIASSAAWCRFNTRDCSSYSVSLPRYLYCK